MKFGKVLQIFKEAARRQRSAERLGIRMRTRARTYACAHARNRLITAAGRLPDLLQLRSVPYGSAGVAEA